MNTLARRLVASLSKSPIIKERRGTQLLIVNTFHNNQLLYNKNDSDNEITPFRFDVEKKGKETFLEIIRIYEKEDRNRKGQLQFMKTALQYMEEFGVNKDIQTYKAIFNIFPKGRYVPENKFQVMNYHYPKHQNMALAILNQMEANFVIPDTEINNMIINTFGIRSLVLKKCWSLLYWLPKFANLNPWPVPQPAPTDPKVLAQFAMEKMSRVDAQADVTVYKTKDIADAIDNTWIVSTMSKTQQELLAVQPINQSLCVEGPFNVWIDQYCIDYYVLKGEPPKREVIYGEYDDVSDLKIMFWERHNFKIPVNVHEQDDGVYYAMCATGTSSKDSLLSWIRCLQKTNPILEKIPVTFKMRSVIEEKPCIDAGENVLNEEGITENRNILDK